MARNPAVEGTWSPAAERARPLRFLVTALVLAVVAAGCGDGGAPPPTSGDALVPGVSLDPAWAFLAVPRTGGRPRLVDLTGDASRELWTGDSDLPPSVAVVALGETRLLLQRADGRVLRYDPARDVLTEAGRLDSGTAEWSRQGDQVVGWSGDRVLQVSPDGAWTYRIEGRVLWAGTTEAGDLVVLRREEGSAAEGAPGRDEGAVVARYPHGGAEPAARAATAGFAPATVTAWGREVVLPDGEDGGPGVTVLALPDLGVRARGATPERPTALAGSPSTHELYVAVGADPARVIVLDRFDLTEKRRVEVPGRVEVLRPGHLGGPLVVRSTRGLFVLPWEAGAPAQLPGEWRPDLPIGLPSGDVLVVRDGEVLRRRPGAGGDVGASPVGEASDWWVPVRWRPIPVRAAPGETAAAPAVVAAGEPGGDTAATGDSAALAPGEPAASSDRERAPVGYYAVVAAARERSGVTRLLEELGAAGFPTRLQPYTDDAGRQWYRGMVGPYEDRPEAEAVGRQLQRERGLSVWINEVDPAAPGR